MLIEDLGEEGLVDELRRLFSNDREDVVLGIGDDAAVVSVPPGGNQLWTTDMLVETVHFQLEWQAPEQLGRKCLVVNLSDLAAMAAKPRFALLSLGIPAKMDAGFLLGVCRGIRQAADEHDVAIVGGDSTASCGGLIINIALGGTADGSVTRTGAVPGDLICVTGDLGDAAGGLLLLSEGRHGEFPSLRRAFIQPEARLAAAAAAAAAGVTSMTDISDGLATDLRHVCAASCVGARVDLAALPVSADLKRACEAYGWDREALVIGGGEDYELLFTAPAASAAGIQAAVASTGIKVTAVGEITAAAGGLIIIDEEGNEEVMTTRGYEHFADG